MNARVDNVRASRSPVYDTLIVGGGFSGIGVAIGLDRAGFHDFLILEQDDGIGGAWHANTYPGVAVDIPSLSYSFSFEKNPYWSRLYAPARELKNTQSIAWKSTGCARVSASAPRW